MKPLELFFPVKILYISQPFGANHLSEYKQWGMLGHNGIDAPCKTGTPIYAAHDGMVTRVATDAKGGVFVDLVTLEPHVYKGGSAYFKTKYIHLLPKPPVTAGQKVRAGDIIGYGDTTGFATGPHLHFGLYPVRKGVNEFDWQNTEDGNGYLGAINPMPYMSSLTAYELRSAFAKIAEILRHMSMIITLLKGRVMS